MMFIALSLSVSACDFGVDIPNQYFVGGYVEYFYGDTDGDGLLTDTYAYDASGLRDHDCADEGNGYEVFTLPERGALGVSCHPKIYVFTALESGAVTLIRN